MKENRFNLIDESWIPVVGKGKVGLRQIFADESISALGGNPVEKIAVFKLLLAIAQSAVTPKDETEWKSLGISGLQKRVSDYLDKYYDCFWLYGEKPFLQMPELKKKAEALSKKEKSEPYKIGNGAFADLMAENNTCVTEYDFRDVSQNDSDKALFLLAVINFAFYGKQPNQELSLEKNLKKNVIAKPGASLGFSNYLHTFGLVENVITSVYYNLISEQNVKSYTWLSEGVGKPFWEMMPTTESDCVTETSKKTLLGHLVPLSRYVLMVDNGLYFTEGVIYHLAKSEKKKGQSVENWIETSMSWYLEKDEIKALNADISKKPWRMLTSMLSLSDTERKYCNLGLSLFINRISEYDKVFSIWSGGIDVSGDSFGKKIKNNDDYVESEIQLHSSAFGDSFCNKLFEEMRKLNEFCSDLQKFVVGYNVEIRGGKSSKNAKQIGSQNIPSVESDYWQQCEGVFQRIVDTCSIENTDQYNQEMDKINAQIWQFVKQIYNQYCPNQSARQLEAWAKNFPKKFEKKRLS